VVREKGEEVRVISTSGSKRGKKKKRFWEGDEELLY